MITPRDGCKLVVRNSKGGGQEDYYVDAVEVVSFGHSFFFRSLEKPKSFLVPVSDYELLELRETRMVLKNVPTERSIKIGGGREAPPRPHYREPRETQPAEEARPREELPQEEMPSPEGAPAESRMDRNKRDRRRRGRRGGRERGLDMREETRPPHVEPERQPTEGPEMTEEQESVAPVSEEAKSAPSFISKLFPPPSTLIKDTLSRYKTAELIEDDVFPGVAEDMQKESLDESLFKHPLPLDEEPPGQIKDKPELEE